MLVYLDLLRSVLDEGEAHPDRTGTGTRSLFGRQIRFDLRDGFPLLTSKFVSLRTVFYELKWFLLGRSDEGWLQRHGVTIWQEWATAEQCGRFGRAAGDLGPIYGPQMRRFNSAEIDDQGTDQIAELLVNLVRDPYSRSHVVTHWHPADVKLVTLPPCHVLWQVHRHSSGELSLHMYQRSADVFLGVPYNIASYALLLMLLATAIGTSPRELVISFGDVHLYRTHEEQARLQLTRDPGFTPRVFIADRLHGLGLETLESVRWEDVALHNYHPHDKIPAPVAI